MTKRIKIKAHIRKDGTKVKEHWRNISNARGDNETSKTIQSHVKKGAGAEMKTKIAEKMEEIKDKTDDLNDVTELDYGEFEPEKPNIDLATGKPTKISMIPKTAVPGVGTTSPTKFAVEHAQEVNRKSFLSGATNMAGQAVEPEAKSLRDQAKKESSSLTGNAKLAHFYKSPHLGQIVGDDDSVYYKDKGGVYKSGESKYNPATETWEGGGKEYVWKPGKKSSYKGGLENKNLQGSVTVNRAKSTPSKTGTVNDPEELNRVKQISDVQKDVSAFNATPQGKERNAVTQYNTRIKVAFENLKFARDSGIIGKREYESQIAGLKRQHGIADENNIQPAKSTQEIGERFAAKHKAARMASGGGVFARSKRNPENNFSPEMREAIKKQKMLQAYIKAKGW